MGPAMPTRVRRALGRSPLKVAPWALGGNVFGWTVDGARGASVLEAFVDEGFNLIDTADVYTSWVPGHTGGESETMIGNWLASSGRRDQVLLATKVGMEMGSGKKGLSRAHILESVDESLRRLRTDHIDLYQAHIDDETVPLEETLETFAELIETGKVRSIGASNFTGARLTEALRVSRERGLPRFESLQPRYNLLERTEFESDLAPVLARHEVGAIPYPSLAGGFLSGKYRSADDAGQSPRGRRAVTRLDERGRRVLAALEAVHERVHEPIAAIALAWLRDRPGVTAPIASATSPEQVHELARSADLVLDPEATAELEAAGRAA